LLSLFVPMRKFAWRRIGEKDPLMRCEVPGINPGTALATLAHRIKSGG